MHIYTIEKYYEIHETMTGEQFMASSMHKLSWKMLKSKLAERASYITKYGNEIPITVYAVRVKGDSYDIFIEIDSTSIIDKSSSDIIEAGFRRLKKGLPENLFNDIPKGPYGDIEIADIYLIDEGKDNGYSNGDLRVITCLSYGTCTACTRSYLLALEFDGYFGKYDYNISYQNYTVEEMMKSGGNNKSSVLIVIALNLIKIYINTLIMLDDINESSKIDSIMDF